VVEHDKLVKLIEATTQSASQSLERLIDDDVSFEDLLARARRQAAEESTADVDDAPVVRFLQKLLLDAIGEGASDLHFEPYEKFYRIRFRVDGILREVAQPPLAIRERLVNPDQGDLAPGHFGKARAAGRAHEARASASAPSISGQHASDPVRREDRDADPGSVPGQNGIESLGYEPEQRDSLVAAITRPTAWCWQPARPAAARPCRCTPV